MKKLVSFAVSLMLLVSLAACGKTNDAEHLDSNFKAEHLGSNFKIVAIDSDQMMLTVEDLDDLPVIEGEFHLQCEDVPIIYCNYEKAHENINDPEALHDIEFDDLIIGD